MNINKTDRSQGCIKTFTCITCGTHYDCDGPLPVGTRVGNTVTVSHCCCNLLCVVCYPRGWRGLLDDAKQTASQVAT
jgi:hypothetical protein